MIEIRIPKNVIDYKAKLFLGFTTRQCLSLALALIINVPLYYFGRKYISEDILGWIIIIIASPLVGFGFFRYNGMNLEKIAKYVVAHYFKPQKRPFIYEKCKLQKIREECVKADFLSRISTSKRLTKRYYKHFWCGIKEEQLYYKYRKQWKYGKGRKRNIRGKRVN